MMTLVPREVSDPRLPTRFRLAALETVDSTNDEAIRRAHQGAPDGTLVWARRQEAGRGRRGRTWVSPEGNFHASLILRPEEIPAVAVQFSFVTALAVGAAIGEFLPPDVAWRLKWPNDVLVRRRKIAGMLLESETGTDGRLNWLVIGAGINLQQHPELSEFPATSLAAEGAGNVTPASALESFGRQFLNWERRWRQEGFAAVRTAWLDRAEGLGEPIKVRLPDRTLHGTFVDLDADGALLLDPADGAQRRVTVGDVFFGVPPAQE